MSTTDTTTSPLDALYVESMKLSAEQRVQLGERLLLSVAAPEEPRLSQAEWIAEIERRIRAHESDPSSSIPLEEAIEAARRIANETS